MKGLRVIASLYPESIHIVARRKSGIKAPRFKGARCAELKRPENLLTPRSLVRRGSTRNPEGALSFARYYGGESDRARTGCVFALADFPSQNVSRVVLSGHADVLPIDDPAVDIALLEYGFLSRSGTHNNEAEIATLNMSALMVVSERLPADIVYTISQSLWREKAQ